MIIFEQCETRLQIIRLCKGIFDLLENTYKNEEEKKLQEDKSMFIPVDLRGMNTSEGKRNVYEQAIAIIEGLEENGISRELVFISVCFTI